MDPDKHEASDSPLSERVHYAKVVALMAAADAEVDPRERDQIDQLCDALSLPDAERASVVAAAEAATDVDIVQALSVIRTSELRFTLYTDCLMVAHADEQIVPEEEQQLGQLADALDISSDQQNALRRLVEVLAAGEAEVEARGDELRASLNDAQIPVRPLAYVSATGFSVVGSTVGLGALATLLGIPTGIGALVGLGVGTMVGVRWLHKQLDRSAEDAPVEE